MAVFGLLGVFIEKIPLALLNTQEVKGNGKRILLH